MRKGDDGNDDDEFVVIVMMTMMVMIVMAANRFKLHPRHEKIVRRPHCRLVWLTFLDFKFQKCILHLDQAWRGFADGGFSNLVPSTLLFYFIIIYFFQFVELSYVKLDLKSPLNKMKFINTFGILILVFQSVEMISNFAFLWIQFWSKKIFHFVILN